MNKSIGQLIVITSFVFGNCVFAGAVEKRYELPNHGALLLNVPDKWIDQVSYPSGDLPPTVHFTQKAGEQFEILFTTMWKTPRAESDFGTAQSIKNLVVGAASDVSSQTVEKNIKVKELGGSNIGYYFSGTDKAPKPGEYKYMSQGAVGINEIMGTFTILTNSPNSAIVEQAINMFGSSRHSPGNLAVTTIEDIKVTASSLGKDCKIIEGAFPVSIQAASLYPMITDTYSALLKPPEQKYYQSLECSSEKGTIYYYQYANQDELEKARGFIQGLIWGEDGPSKAHPELIQNEKNVLVIISSHHPQVLQKLINQPQ